MPYWTVVSSVPHYYTATIEADSEEQARELWSKDEVEFTEGEADFDEAEIVEIRRDGDNAGPVYTALMSAEEFETFVIQTRTRLLRGDQGTCACHDGVHTFRNDPDPCIDWSNDA